MIQMTHLINLYTMKRVRDVNPNKNNPTSSNISWNQYKSLEGDLRKANAYIMKNQLLHTCFNNVFSCVCNIPQVGCAIVSHDIFHIEHCLVQWMDCIIHKKFPQLGGSLGICTITQYFLHHFSGDTKNVLLLQMKSLTYESPYFRL